MSLGIAGDFDLSGLPGPASQLEISFRRLLLSCNQHLQQDEEHRSKPKFHAVSCASRPWPPRRPGCRWMPGPLTAYAPPQYVAKLEELLSDLEAKQK
jgi:hypothetical protein